MSNQFSSGFQSVRPLLRRIGLDDKEVEVYLAVLALKIGRASAVAKTAKQSRSHTYLILRSLKEKGLVGEVERGKVIHFIAEQPERLLQYVQERERELHSLQPLVQGVMPLFQSITKPLMGAPRVTMLQGKAGMKQLYRDALSAEICGIFNPKAMYDTLGENIVTMLFGTQTRMKGRDLVVAGEAAERYICEVPQDESYAIRTLPQEVTFDTDTICFGDTVAYFAYDEERTIVRIENANIANAFRAWFEILWAASRPAKP
ncbi:MAG TPA: helix-turn-helix domain-containing protein [Candidatus Peribacteraceae bacterium]|nr:helix-turn-helix domain-containing protein [Candidatus Peribacteraceae bacterium]